MALCSYVSKYGGTESLLTATSGRQGPSAGDFAKLNL